MKLGFLRCAGLLFAIALLAASPAAASYDPIAGGSALLKLDPSFTRLLTRNDLALSGREGAKVAGSRVTLPLTGGRADPTIGKAELLSHGELLISAGARKVAFTKIELKTKPTPLFAKVGGGQLKVAKAARVSLPREGFGNRLQATDLRLTEKTATRLNRRLHIDAFAEGQRLGTLRAATQPATLAILAVGRLTLQFDPAIYGKLTALSTPVNPFFPAEHSGPTFTLPIAPEGHIAPDGSTANLRTSGGIEFLRLGFGQIFWADPWFEIQQLGKPASPHLAATAELDLEPVPRFAGKLGRTTSLEGLPSQTSGLAVSSDPQARTVTVSAAPLFLTPESAAQFNAAFAEGKPEFQPGELLGTASFTAQTQ